MKSMKRALALLLVSGTAYAGGVQRPNGISARGTGMGGAWAAWADDPTAILFNPGALDATESQVSLGAEYVIGPRKYTPLNPDGTTGDPQSTTVTSPVPSLGVVGRFNTDDEPSRITLGAGLFNTFGGQTSYAKTGMPALDTTQDVTVELDAGASVRISDRLSVGAAARLGVGFFHVATTMKPFDSDLSSNGVGFGLGVGALFRPSDHVRIGLNWRSPLRITTKGSGTIVMPAGAAQYDVEHEQNWPQQVQLGVGVQAAPKVKLAFQADWAQWSSTDTIEVHFAAGSGVPNQIYPEYWRDTYALRVGTEYAVSAGFQLRAGGWYDSPAVPDLSIERQYVDSHKFGVSLGTSLHAAGWRFDFAADGIIPHNRHVPDNHDEVMGIGALVNIAPGDYIGSLITFEAAAARQF